MNSVSVIIPSWNEEQDIERCLLSWLGQTIKPAEILVVDSSTDRTPDIVKRIAKEHPEANIQYHFVPKKNIASARNYGWKHAKYKIIFFCDADSVIKDDKVIEKIINTFSNPAVKVACVGGGFEYTTFLQRCSFIRSILSNFHYSIFVGKKEPQYINCLRKTTIAELGGYDETIRYGEDIEIGRRAIKRYGKITRTPANIAAIQPSTISETMRQTRGVRDGYADYLDTYIKDHPGMLLYPLSPQFWGLVLLSFFIFKPLFYLLAFIIGFEIFYSYFKTRECYPKTWWHEYLIPAFFQVLVLSPFRAVYLIATIPFHKKT